MCLCLSLFYFSYYYIIYILITMLTVYMSYELFTVSLSCSFHISWKLLLQSWWRHEPSPTPLVCFIYNILLASFPVASKKLKLIHIYDSVIVSKMLS